MPDPSDGMTYPNRPEEMQDMEMKPVVVGPGAYASPDPNTENARLLPLTDHPLADELSGDYGADVSGQEQQAKAPADMTVAELDERYGDEPDYPADENKDEKVAFAEQVEEAKAEDEAAESGSEIDQMTVAELDERYGDEEGYPVDGKKSDKVEFAKSVEEA